MKKIILLILTVFASVYVFGQDTDSTYTTVKDESVSGFQGFNECNHEWFTSVNETEDSAKFDNVIHVRQQVISRQCTECGKQISTITTWTTYLKNNEDED